MTSCDEPLAQASLVGWPARASLHLIDLLEMLPVVMLDSTLWPVLRDRSSTGDVPFRSEAEEEFNANGSRGSFKLVCRQSRQLADLLTTAVTHNLSRFPDQARSDSAAAEAQWWRALEQRRAFLARLPRVDSLTLKRWSSEADLVTTLWQVGSATQGRLTRLTLYGDELSAAGMRAVRLACPALRELHVAPSDDVFSHAAASLFHPLQEAACLTKLVFCHVGREYPSGTDAALCSLGGMSRLRHLDLTMKDGDSDELLFLTGLHALQHLQISIHDDEFSYSIFDVAPLFRASSQLTSLTLHSLEYDGSATFLIDHPALALLGALTGMKSLNLGKDFFIDSPAWGALRQLSRLTHLRVGGVEAMAPVPPVGGLPLLQHLHVGRGEDNNILRPSTLLQALLPLLPLPSLMKLDGLIDAGLYLDISHEGGVDAAVQAAALTLALRHLAAAPQLHLGTELRFYGASVLQGSALLLPQVAEALRVGLSGRATHVSLRLDRVHLPGAPWPALHAALPALQRLTLSYCLLSCADVAYLVQTLHGLRHLSLQMCTGLGVDEHAWVLVAAVCSRPLEVKVYPALPARVVFWCQAEQERLFGQIFITWK